MVVESRSVAFVLFAALCVALLFAIALPSPAAAATFTCSFQASCTQNATQAGLLRAVNVTNGYSNAHIQLMNDSTTGYNYTLCCGTDGSHFLNNSCANANATTVLRASAVENAHLQLPAINTYSSSVCMALAPGNLTCEYVNSTSCTAGYSPIASMASSETNGGLYNQTNAHVANFSYYRLNVCCKGGNSVPSVPVLSSPLHNNNTVFERNVTFQWGASTDPDGDAITYNLSVVQSSCPNANSSGISTTYSTPSSELCVDRVYNWTVQACDAGGCSAWASIYNFTIASVAGLTFIVNTTDFGSLANGVTVNTTANSPPPFLVQNTGNVVLNVTFKARSSLYTTVALGNDSFQYMARVNQTGAFDTATSQMNFTNVTASYTSLFKNLKYQTSTSKASIDILLRVPAAEGAGAKSAIVEVLGNG